MNKNMKPLNLEPGEGSAPHRLYDLTIEDINERREKSIVMPTATQAMNFLGVCNSTFYKNRVPGTQIFSKKLNKKYAVRPEKETAHSK
jgi:hypothetical protein